MPRKKNESTFKTTEVVILVCITCVVSLLMGLIINKSNNKVSYKLADEEIQEFIKQYNYIVDNYYEDVDKKALLNAAIEGMIASLGDPYSNYLDETTSTSFNAELNGQYEGIGVEVATSGDGSIIVTKVFDNSPASKAGLKEGDIVTKFNNHSLEDKDSSSLASMIKEADNKSFDLEIKRDEQIIKVTVKKENVTLTSVTSDIINSNNKKIGYIDVSIFALNTDSQFEEALKKLENDKIDSLIIDLRGNSGGHLTVVENMISMFLDSSHVIYQTEFKGEKTKYYSKGKKTKDYPIVVLVDSNSASASEMMTAALKESYKATIVGTTTFGKGTVQELRDNDKDQYKITTKKWLTPNGEWINEVGITPDYEVKLDAKYYQNPIRANDNQLNKAISILAK